MASGINSIINRRHRGSKEYNAEHEARETMASGINSINNRHKGSTEYNEEHEDRETGNWRVNQGGYREEQRRGNWRPHRGRYVGGHRGDHTPVGSDTSAKQNEFIINHRNTKLYEEKCPEFEQPRAVGWYSVDTDRNFGLDKSQLKFIDRSLLPENKEMKVEFDLNNGIDKDKPYIGSSNDTFENLLQWIISNSTDLLSEEKNTLSVDFISSRGCLTDIMNSLYFPRQIWSLYVIMHNGSIYMKRSRKKTNQSSDGFDFPPIVSRSGSKFEQLMVGGDSTEGIDGNQECRCVLSTHFDGMELLYTAKLDGADPELYEEDFHDMSSFVTIKCCRELSKERSVKMFYRHKTGQTWVENHLAGIPRVVFGFRSDDFIVHTLKLINTEDLPELAQGMWKPNGCMNFLNQFLKYVKKIASQHPEVIIEFEKKKYGNISWQVSDVQQMLPTWYTDNLFEDQ